MIEKPLYTFISTGDKGAMYTLRLKVLVSNLTAGSYQKDEFVCVLRNNYEKAVALAQERTKSMTVPFKLAPEFKNEPESGQVVNYRDLQLEKEHQEKELQQANYDRDVLIGVLLIGKYKGLSVLEVAEIDPNYLHFMDKKFHLEQAISPRKVTIDIIKQWVAKNPRRNAVWGTVGEVTTGKMMLSNRVHFLNAYGSSYLFDFTADNGANVIYYTREKPFLELSIGANVTVSALVHSQEEVNGSSRTLIKKAKLL
jgi:hypothetical protein